MIDEALPASNDFSQSGLKPSAIGIIWSLVSAEAPTYT
jgi:hypothetical protein